MLNLIEHGLQQTASLWPDIERAYKWIHQVAHILNNHEDKDAATAQRRFNGMVGAMARHRDRAGLFHCYAVPNLPHTNNDLEHEFGSRRCHERRATGRKAASPAAVLRGEARLVAAIATRRRAPSGPDLGRADRKQWKDLRQRLDRRRQARTLRTRFRHDPAAYLAELEEKARQLTLPA